MNTRLLAATPVRRPAAVPEDYASVLVVPSRKSYLQTLRGQAIVSEPIAPPRDVPRNLDRWAEDIRGVLQTHTQEVFLVGCGAGCLALMRAVAASNIPVGGVLLLAPLVSYAQRQDAPPVHPVRFPVIVVVQRRSDAAMPSAAGAWAHALGGYYVECAEDPAAAASTNFAHWTYGALLLDRLARSARIYGQLGSPRRSFDT